MMNSDPKLAEFINKEYRPSELKGMAQAAYELKVQVLKLHELPCTADAMLEKYNAEKAFRQAITKSLYNWIEQNCNKCPMGFERIDCKAKSCPIRTVDKMLTGMLNELEQILPGGIQ